MNVYMSLIYKKRREGKQKSAMHGADVNPLTNGKQINWDPIQRHDKKYIFESFQQQNLLLNKKNIVNMLNINGLTVDQDDASEKKPDAVRMEDQMSSQDKKSLLGKTKNWFENPPKKSYIKVNTNKHQKRKTTASEDDVLKEPQINFQYFGSMSESGSESVASSRRGGNLHKSTNLTIKTGDDKDRTRLSHQSGAGIRKIEPFQMRKEKQELDEVKEDDEENKYFGDRIKSDKLDIFEFVKNTKTAAQRLNKTMDNMEESKMYGGRNTAGINSMSKSRRNNKQTNFNDANSSRFVHEKLP